MPRLLRDWCEEDLEEFMGNLLRIGVLRAGSVVLVGAIIYLVRHGTNAPNYQIFRGEPVDLRSIALIAHGTISLEGREIIQLGLLLLIATPVARVAFSVAAFVCQRDGTYVLVTLIVLCTLFYSLIGGYL